MARVKRDEAEAEAVSEIQGAETASLFGGDDETMMEEHSKIVEMLSAFRGTDSEAQAYLYRIDNTRGKMRGRFLSVYPVDVSIDTIYDDAQRKWKGGDFSLVIRDGAGMRRRQNFSVEPLPSDGVTALDNTDADMGKRLDRMIEVAEKTTLLDRASRMMNPPAEKASGGDTTTMLMLEMFRESQKTNALLMQTMLSNNSREREKTPASDMIELIRLGADLKEGRVPGGDDDDSMSGMLGKFAPVIAAVLGGNQQQQTPHPSRAALPPAANQPTAPTPKPQPTAEELVRARVVDELVFMSSFALEDDEEKRNDRLDHVLNYIEAYTPDVLRQAAMVDCDTFLKMIVPMHPALSERVPFLTALHSRNREQFTEDSPDTP